MYLRGVSPEMYSSSRRCRFIVY